MAFRDAEGLLHGVGRWLTTVVVVTALAVPTLAAGQATSEDPRAEAARIFAAGDQAYAAGKYLAAAGAYERAHALHPDPKITFSIAQAYRRHYFEDEDVAWLERAQALYRRYLEEQPSGGRRSHAVTHLSNIAIILAGRQQAGTTPDQAGGGPAPETPPPTRTEILVASTTPHALASIDGDAPSPVPLVKNVSAGPHRIRVVASGHEERVLDVIVTEDRLAVVPLDLEPMPSTVRVRSSVESATTWVDGVLFGEGATAELTLGAGRHEVAVAAPGHELFVRTIEVAPGDRREIQADLSMSTNRVAAFATLGGAGAFGVVAAVLAGVALSAEGDAAGPQSEILRGRSLSPDEAARANEALALRDVTRALAGASLGLAGAAGLTSTLLFALDTPAPSRPGRPKGAASLSWSLAF